VFAPELVEEIHYSRKETQEKTDSYAEKRTEREKLIRSKLEAASGARTESAPADALGRLLRTFFLFCISGFFLFHHVKLISKTLGNV
jgi:hypothetical protein